MTNEKSDTRLCGGLPCQWPACEAHGKQCRAAESAQAAGEVASTADIAEAAAWMRYFIRNQGSRVPAPVQLEAWALMLESLSAQVEQEKQRADALAAQRAEIEAYEIILNACTEGTEWAYGAVPEKIDALRQRVEELEGLLAPFAKFACEPPCDCNNCRARAALARRP